MQTHTLNLQSNALVKQAVQPMQLQTNGINVYFSFAEVLPFYHCSLKKQMRKKLKNKKYVGGVGGVRQKRMVLRNFPQKLFDGLWPNMQNKTEFREPYHSLEDVKMFLSQLVDGTCFHRETGRHLSQDCMYAEGSCLHVQQVHFALPITVNYNPSNTSLTIAAWIVRESYGGTRTKC